MTKRNKRKKELREKLNRLRAELRPVEQQLREIRAVEKREKEVEKRRLAAERRQNRMDHGKWGFLRVVAGASYREVGEMLDEGPLQIENSIAYFIDESYHDSTGRWSIFRGDEEEVRKHAKEIMGFAGIREGEIEKLENPQELTINEQWQRKRSV